MIDWIKWQRVKWFYCSMRESVINRSLSPSSPFLTYLNRIHPLHPIVVAHSMQPFVFSPQYAVSELADGLVHYLSRLLFFTLLITLLLLKEECVATMRLRCYSCQYNEFYGWVIEK